MVLSAAQLIVLLAFTCSAAGLTTASCQGGLCSSEADEAKQELAEAAKHPLTQLEQKALFDKAWRHFDQSSTGELNADELKGMMVTLS